MLATVVATGSTIRITGTNESDFVEVFDSGGQVLVFDGEADLDTGIATDELDRLTISLKKGNDSLFIGAGIRVNKSATIRLGNGTNAADIAGVYSNVRIIGGADSEAVDINGLFAFRRASVNLKGGDDSLNFSIVDYIDGIDNGVVSEDDALDLLESPPRISLRLGSGEDTLAITNGAEPIDDDFIEDLLDDFGFESLDDLVTELEGLADEAGLSNILRVVRVNGGSGTDVFLPEGLSQLLGIFGARISNFEPAAND